MDYTDTAAQEKDAKMSALAAEIDSRLSFIESEIADAPEDLIRAAMDKTERAKHYLAEILRGKPHRLSAETEKVLAALGPVFGAPYDIYHMTKLADMKFGSFTVNGREYPLGYSLFEDEYEYEADTDVRRAAFRAFCDKLREYENTTAATYNTYLTQQRIMAKQRGFADMFEADLFADLCSTLSSARHPDVPASDITVLIGPEGDFSIGEVNDAMACGYRSATLGESRLRTETAGLMAVATSDIALRSYSIGISG